MINVDAIVGDVCVGGRRLAGRLNLLGGTWRLCNRPCSRPKSGTARRVVYSSAIFLRFPRGAGSIWGNDGAFASTGVVWYVTVRVTTSRTLTRRDLAGFFSGKVVFGDTAENGDWTDLALAGDRTLAGEYGDWGM